MTSRISSARDRLGATPEDEEEGGALAHRLRERIRREGPVTFREWMRAALYDERDGYYRREGRVRWGRAGDYRTSPETSPLFAATFARHLTNLYEALGRPPVLHLLEAGGGAGRFAHGLLNTLRRDSPQLFDSVRYIFDETSEGARASAAELLAPFAERVECRRVGEIEPPLPSAVLFSNELLDAFPVHRVVKRAGRVREFYVGLDDGRRFVWVEGEPSTPRIDEHFRQLGIELVEGQAAEVNLDAEAWMTGVVAAIGRGFVVTVDYGDDAEGLFGGAHGREGTLRGFRGHEFVEDILDDPGGHDLTSTVNWTHVRSVGEAAGLKTVAFERLDAFLLRTGLLEQLERECALARDEGEVASLRLGAREMILPGRMASHFQVLIQEKI